MSVLTVANLGLGVEREFAGFRDPVPVDRCELGRVESEFRLSPDRDGVFYNVLSDHEECGTSPDLDPFPLTDRIAEGSLVLSEHFPLDVEYIPRLLVEAFFQKLLHAHFPDETKPLTVPSICVRESCLLGDLAHLGLVEVSDREKRVRELKLIESGQEV